MSAEEYILKLEELLKKAAQDFEVIKILGKGWAKDRAHEAFFDINSGYKKASREYQQKKIK